MHCGVLPRLPVNGLQVKIIHDQSSSGATLFIEPESIVFLNNQMQEKELEEQREIEKILKQLTQEVRQQIDALTINIEALAHLDLIVAKARFTSQLCNPANSFART